MMRHNFADSGCSRPARQRCGSGLRHPTIGIDLTSSNSTAATCAAIVRRSRVPTFGIVNGRREQWLTSRVQGGIENKFAHDETLRFKAIARRNKLFGLWVAAQLGKSGMKPRPMRMRWSWLISRNPELTISSAK